MLLQFVEVHEKVEAYLDAVVLYTPRCYGCVPYQSTSRYEKIGVMGPDILTVANVETLL
jgi:hypothetical protein